MSQVGTFPGIHQIHRRTIRGPVNPLDKSTIVSIYPKEIDEKKHTIQPGRFIISPGSLEHPSILVVGTSSWWRDVDEDQPLLEIPTGSIQVADSIVKDYCNGIFECDMSTSMPGLFYVPGEQTIVTIKEFYQDEINRVHKRQLKFWSNLVKAADSLWARSNGNPLAISDDMRLAARELGIVASKDWMKDFERMDMVRCKACGSMKNPQYPVCATCRAIDRSHPSAGDIEFVGLGVKMSAPDLLAGTVMDRAASLMNDSAKSVYTYAAQVPYLQMAFQELQEIYELNSISSTQSVSSVITLLAGQTEITYNAVGLPRLPDDMVEPSQLWERQTGVDPFIPMTRREFLPHNFEGVETNQFIYFIWQEQKIKVLAANQSNDIKIDYIKYLFTTIVDENSSIGIINAATFLEFRTAGLLAEFIERNVTSANSLNAQAILALDRATGIGIKGKQSINTRRRPFRSAYKRRGWI